MKSIKDHFHIIKVVIVTEVFASYASTTNTNTEIIHDYYVQITSNCIRRKSLTITNKVFLEIK